MYPRAPAPLPAPAHLGWGDAVGLRGSQTSARDTSIFSALLNQGRRRRWASRAERPKRCGWRRTSPLLLRRGGVALGRGLFNRRLAGRIEIPVVLRAASPLACSGPMGVRPWCTTTTCASGGTQHPHSAPMGGGGLETTSATHATRLHAAMACVGPMARGDSNGICVLVHCSDRGASSAVLCRASGNTSAVHQRLLFLGLVHAARRRRLLRRGRSSRSVYVDRLGLKRQVRLRYTAYLP